MESDNNLIAIACKRFVDTVVDNLIDELMETGRMCIADIHPRPFAYRLKPFQNGDRTCIIGALSSSVIVVIPSLP